MIVAAVFTFLVQLLSFDLPRRIARPTISDSHSFHSPLLFFLATRSYSQLTLTTCKQQPNKQQPNQQQQQQTLSLIHTHTHTSFLPSLPFLSFPFLSFPFLFFSFLFSLFLQNRQHLSLSLSLSLFSLFSICF